MTCCGDCFTMAAPPLDERPLFLLDVTTTQAMEPP
jgi:hypothetical protein